MSRFADILRETDKRLDLPQPVRSRIVLEMAADLEDLFEHHRDLGLPDEEAEERARESFALGDETLDELVRIHTSGFRRFLDQLGDQGRRTWERIAFGLLLLFFVGLGGGQMLSRELLRDAGTAGWVVAAVTAAAFALSAYTFYVLYLRQDRELRRAGGLVPVVLVLGAADLLVGVYGWNLNLSVWLRDFVAAGELDLVPFIRCLTHGSALVVTALVGAVLAFLMWYILHSRLVRLQHDEALALLED